MNTVITLENLRAAALSAHPWTELDRLVRAELSAGRLTKAIYEEILGLQEAVRETPGFTEDADDAIGDALDALTGMCHPNCQYKNPPDLTPPASTASATAAPFGPGPASG